MSEHKQFERKDIDELLWKKLPDWMDEKQKKIKINNLLSEMRKKNRIVNVGSDTQSKWVIISANNDKFN